MITTCKELAEILMQTPNHKITVSTDDGCGMQCDAEIEKVVSLKNSDTISIIPVQPELYD